MFCYQQIELYRQIDRYKQIDRQIDNQIDRQIDRQKDIEIDTSDVQPSTNKSFKLNPLEKKLSLAQGLQVLQGVPEESNTSLKIYFVIF